MEKKQDPNDVFEINSCSANKHTDYQEAFLLSFFAGL